MFQKFFRPMFNVLPVTFLVLYMIRYITSSKEVVEESLGSNQGDEALDEIRRLNERNKKLEVRAQKRQKKTKKQNAEL